MMLPLYRDKYESHADASHRVKEHLLTGPDPAE